MYSCRYVFQFSEVVAPLHNLTRKNVAFEWSPSCEESFGIFKSKLVEPPTLAYPQTHPQASPFVLHTDASAHGLGAVFEQDNRVVAYVSRSLTSSEHNYSVIQKECLAIICDLASENRPYNIFNPNGVISIML